MIHYKWLDMYPFSYTNRLLSGKIGLQKEIINVTDSQMTNFVPIFRPKGLKCDQISFAYSVWLDLLNILKQKSFEKFISFLPIFKLEKAPKNRLFRVTMS